MKLKDNCKFAHFGDSAALIPLSDNGSNSVVSMNSSAGFIISCLQEETTRENVLAKMRQKYGEDEPDLEIGLDKVLNTLRQLNVLSE